MKIQKLNESLIHALNNLPQEPGKNYDRSSIYDVVKEYQNILRQYPVGTVLTHEIDAGTEKFTKIEDGEYGFWEHFRMPWEVSQKTSEFDVARWLACRANITRGKIIQEKLNNMKIQKLNESNDSKYITDEIASKTNSQEIKDAIDKNNLSVLVRDNTWYTEKCPNGLGKALKDEMKKLYPDLKHMYGESTSIKTFGAKGNKLNEDNVNSPFFNNIDEDIIEVLSTSVPEEPITGEMVKCSKSAPANALYYVAQGEEVTFNLGNVKLPMKQISHCWITHNGEVLQTRNSKYPNDLITKFSIELTPSDVDKAVNDISRLINSINGKNESLSDYADDRANKWVIEESLEENVQYGVHQFSTDSIIFRGTEEECGKYIDNNKNLWDDAEVYMMNPNDPHYKKDLDEASYGGAFDIEDSQFFTREDIDNFAEEVLNHINETFEEQFHISGAYITDGVIELEISNETLGDFSCNKAIDMRKVKEPWHLKRAYATDCAADLINQIKEVSDMFESINESTTENAHSIEAGAKFGIASIINSLIVSEYAAIEEYNSAIATAQSEGFDNIVKVLTDIQAEENVHVGQLQELMKLVDPNAVKVEEGKSEGAEQLSDTFNDDDDVFDFFTSDDVEIGNEDDIDDDEVETFIKKVKESMEQKSVENSIDIDELEEEVIIESTEPWEDIYKSFKDIETQLKGDGEAITATIDKLYQDNKHNPDFKKAYDKWASNE